MLLLQKNPPAWLHLGAAAVRLLLLLVVWLLLLLWLLVVLVLEGLYPQVLLRQRQLVP